MARPCICPVCLLAITNPATEPAPAKAPYRLVYAEDLAPGMLVCTDGSRTTWATLLEVRRHGGIISAVSVDQAGDQQPIIVNDWAMLPVRVDA